MFSVIIPVYNHAAYVEEAVQSVMHTPLVTEVLLIDDGSDDESYEVLKKLAVRYRRVRQIESTGNLGAPQRLNELVSNATESWISILNSDDCHTLGRFEHIRQTATVHGADLVMGATRMIDGDSICMRQFLLDPPWATPEQLEFLRRLDPIKNTRDLLPALVCTNIATTTSGLSFKKSLFDKVGGFRDYRYVHDWDFAIRATQKGRASVTGFALTEYRRHPQNTILEDQSELSNDAQTMLRTILSDFPSITEQPKVSDGLALNTYFNVNAEMKKKTPKTVVVTGMHRSGTSLLTQILTALGCEPGDQDDHLKANQWNPDGYFEQAELVELNADLLHSQHCNWSNCLAFNHQNIDSSTATHARRRLNHLLSNMNRSEAGSAGTIVIKDPRLCLTLPVLEHEPTALVFALRNPLEVAASLDKRDQMGIATALALWELYNVRAAPSINRFQAYVVDYDDLVLNPNEQIARLVAYLDSRKALCSVSAQQMQDATACVKTRRSPPATRKEYADFLMPWHTALWNRLKSRDFSMISNTGVSKHSTDLLRQHQRFVRAERDARPPWVMRQEMKNSFQATIEVFKKLDRRLALIEEKLNSE